MVRLSASAALLLLVGACNGSAPGGTTVDALEISDGPAPVIPDAAAAVADAPVADAAAALSSPDAAGAVVAPGPDTTVSAFNGTHVYFAGMDNQRMVDATVKFPAMPLTYQNITLTLALRCPPAPGGCDFWDRRAYLGVVRHLGTADSVTEILRFMTPYRVGAHWSVDVTDLRPLLSGDVTLRVFIDTWVGPGNAQGAGWLVDASFDMKGGMPARHPIAVIPLWDETEFDYGDPLKPVTAAIPQRSVDLPPGTTGVELRALITGHGQGNLDNCAEFCSRSHTFTVGGMPFTRQVWRDDCARTAVPGQFGTASGSRAGWCPGADVVPWTVDVTSAAGAGPVTVGYAVAPYENSCRPDAPQCAGCALGTGCAYDNGNHTLPQYALSALLVAFGP